MDLNCPWKHLEKARDRPLTGQIIPAGNTTHQPVRKTDVHIVRGMASVLGGEKMLLAPEAKVFCPRGMRMDETDVQKSACDPAAWLLRGGEAREKGMKK